MMNSINSKKSQQQGAILIISLVFLTLLAIAGVATMRMVVLDSKLVANQIDHEIAQQAAEAALAEAEAYLYNLGHDLAKIECDDATNTNYPAGTSCSTIITAPSGAIGYFPENECVDGLCFYGSFTDHSDVTTCSVNASSESTELYQSATNWANGKAKTVDAAFDVEGVAQEAKFLIDFRCFTEVGEAIYRLTASAKGKTLDSRVLLQSYINTGSQPGISSLMSVRGKVERHDCTDFSVNFQTCSQANTNDPSSVSYNSSLLTHSATNCEGESNPNIVQLMDHNKINGYSFGSFEEWGWDAVSSTQVLKSSSYDPINYCTTSPLKQSTAIPLTSNVAQASHKTISMTNDQYFAQYFGTTDRNSVYTYDPDKDSLPVISVNPADFLTTSFSEYASDPINNPSQRTSLNRDDPVLIVVNGDFEMDYFDSQKLNSVAGNPNAILLIRGDLTFDTTSYQSTIDLLAFLYVEGNMISEGSTLINVPIAIEENLVVRTSYTMTPSTDPSGILDKAFGIPASRAGWSQKNFYFQ